MLRSLLLVTLVAITLSANGSPQRAANRKIACRTPENAASCYWTHGRLGVYNGGVPNVRLWKIGTKRILGILSGPDYNLADEEKEGPELPPNVERTFKPFSNRIFADFEVCPLEPEKTGVMQRVCIESAKNIVVGR
jgi:hypothetical protein